MIDNLLAGLLNTTHQYRLKADAIPPWRKMQFVIFWGVLIIASLLTGLAVYYAERIHLDIKQDIDALFELRPLDRPLIQKLINVNGRDVTLRGTAEAGLLSDYEIGQIRQIPGIRLFTNALEQDFKPSPEWRFEKDMDSISMSGKLAGSDFDVIYPLIQSLFADLALSDRVSIDDRLARPVWLDGLDHALDSLADLPRFRLYGWDDAILIEGEASSERQLQATRFAIGVQLNQELTIELQLHVQSDESQPSLSMVSGWNGAVLSGVAANQETRNRIIRGFAAMLNASEFDEQNVQFHLDIEPSIQHNRLMLQTADLLPKLGRVHDLRVQTTATGLSIWGRVDESTELGQIVSAVEQSDLSAVIDNQISVDPAGRSPAVSIFRDRQRAVVTGRLPGESARRKLLSALQQSLGVKQIEDLISIEPNVAYSRWLDRWPSLLPVMPQSVFGLTMSGSGAFVSGEVINRASEEKITRAIAEIFLDGQQVNWLTVRAD